MSHKMLHKTFTVEQRVFIQEPHGALVVPYVGTIVAIEGKTLYIDIDFESSLTSPLIADLVKQQGHDTANYPVRTLWATPHGS